MTNNPIVDEVRRTREQILARYDNDLDAYAKDLQRRTEEAARAGRTVLPLPPDSRTVSPTDPAKKAG